MRNCAKGYSCGKTCINRERSCRKELTGQSVRLCDSLASLITEGSRRPAAPAAPAAQPKIVIDSNELRSLRDISEKFSHGDLRGAVYASVSDLRMKDIIDSDGYFVTLSFTVNDSYDFMGEGSEAERLKLGLSMFKQLKKIVSQLPEGTIVHNSPVKEDEREESRVRAYKKAGFSEPDPWGDMWGVIENSKIRPITRRDIANAN